MRNISIAARHINRVDIFHYFLVTFGLFWLLMAIFVGSGNFCYYFFGLGAWGSHQNLTESSSAMYLLLFRFERSGTM